MDRALEHDLRARRHLEAGAERPRDLGAPAPEEARERVLGERVRDRGDRGEGSWRGPPRGRRRPGTAPPAAPRATPGSRARPPVGEPAHDDPVAADDLLAVDAEVLPPAVRPRVMTRAQVTRGPASSGQQVWTGHAPRSTASPSRTTSRHGGERVSRGDIARIWRKMGSDFHASRRPRGGSGWRRKARSSPISRSAATLSAPIARATRSRVPKRLASTGIRCPAGRSKRSAGPPPRRVRSQTAVISRRGSTSARTRTRSPEASRPAMKSRRSR